MNDFDRILIVGATSAIARATARHFAREGAAFFLVGRNDQRLSAVAGDLTIRGARAADYFLMDADETHRHEEMVDAAANTLGGIDIALIAHGVLPEQAACEENPAAAVDSFRTNALSTISLLSVLAGVFERRGAGTIAVISSVAGDRGRQSNYVYGSAKAAVDVYAQGMRNRLHAAGVHVLTVKPGFTDTPMTAHLPKNALYSSPGRVGGLIHSAIRKRKDVVYAPGWWRLVMAVIKAIPEPVFKRLNL